MNFGIPKIYRETPDLRSSEVLFVPHWLGKVALPVSPVTGNEYFAVNGKHRIHMLSPQTVGLPYGGYPRLILCYLTSIARITRRRHIPLGKSQADFLRTIGKRSTGGEKGSVTCLKMHMKRLFSTTLLYEYGDEHSFEWEHYPLAERGEFAWNPGAKITALEGYLTLGEKFFEDAILRSFPAKRETLERLAGKPTQFDLYCWLTSRAFTLKKPIQVSWEQLRSQMGNNTKNKEHFKQTIKTALFGVSQHYPEANFRVDNSRGILLLPFPPHVQPTTPKYCE